MFESKVLRWGAICFAALVALAAAPSPARAASGTTTVDIRSGSNGVRVGSATFARTIDGAGSETLTIDLTASGGIDQAHVCISRQPYSSRVPPGQCPYQQQRLGTTARFVIPLGTAYVGDPVYTQTSVVTKGSTAFAGWQDGKPFYGNLSIAAVVGTVEAAAGHVIGGLTLTVLLGGVLMLALGLSRRRPPGRHLNRTTTVVSA